MNMPPRILVQLLQMYHPHKQHDSVEQPQHSSAPEIPNGMSLKHLKRLQGQHSHPWQTFTTRESAGKPKAAQDSSQSCQRQAVP